MKKIVIHPTATAQWHELVSEAQVQSGNVLGEELESYLVFLLLRYTSHPEMAESIIAEEWLQGHQQRGRLRDDKLRDVGDKCLLFSGLFPQHAKRRRVPISYFVQLGKHAYRFLANSTIDQTTMTQLFMALHAEFVQLMDVLHSIRAMGSVEQVLDLSQAEDLWRNVGSQHAQEILQEYAKEFAEKYGLPNDFLLH